MDTSFWQNVLLVILGLLQSVVNLFIWEKHQQPGSNPDQPDQAQTK